MANELSSIVRLSESRMNISPRHERPAPRRCVAPAACRRLPSFPSPAPCSRRRRSQNFSNAARRHRPLAPAVSHALTRLRALFGDALLSNRAKDGADRARRSAARADRAADARGSWADRDGSFRPRQQHTQIPPDDAGFHRQSGDAAVDRENLGGGALYPPRDRRMARRKNPEPRLSRHDRRDSVWMDRPLSGLQARASLLRRGRARDPRGLRGRQQSSNRSTAFSPPATSRSSVPANSRISSTPG